MHASTVILISFATAVVTSVTTVYVVQHYDIIKEKEQAAIVVPDFRNLSENEARTIAAAARINMLVGAPEPSPDARPGTVIRQSLPAGQSVAPDYPITVVLAEQLPKVPALARLTVEAATERLKAAGYTLQIGGKVPDDEVPLGQIVSQLPSPDSAYVKGAAVTVQVSSGPGHVEVPKLAAMGYTKATKEIEALGLKPVVSWVSLAETPTYAILGQKPEAGSKVAVGSEVQLTVNR